MRTVLPFLVLALLAFSPSPSEAQAGKAPSYSIETYCESVSQVVGGSYQIKRTCMEEERKALKQIRALPAVEERITSYCNEVAAVVGGSYQIYLTCVQEEMKAKRGMRR